MSFSKLVAHSKIDCHNLREKPLKYCIKFLDKAEKHIYNNLIYNNYIIYAYQCLSFQFLEKTSSISKNLQDSYNIR